MTINYNKMKLNVQSSVLYVFCMCSVFSVKRNIFLGFCLFSASILYCNCSLSIALWFPKSNHLDFLHSVHPFDIKFESKLRAFPVYFNLKALATCSLDIQTLMGLFLSLCPVSPPPVKLCHDGLHAGLCPQRSGVRFPPAAHQQ